MHAPGVKYSNLGHGFVTCNFEAIWRLFLSEKLHQLLYALPHNLSVSFIIISIRFCSCLICHFVSRGFHFNTVLALCPVHVMPFSVYQYAAVYHSVHPITPEWYWQTHCLLSLRLAQRDAVFFLSVRRLIDATLWFCVWNNRLPHWGVWHVL